MPKMSITKKQEQVVYDLVVGVAEKIQDDLDVHGWETPENIIDELRSDPVSGFIPFYNGGFQLNLIVDIQTLINSGKTPWFLKSEADKVEKQLREDCLESTGIDLWEETNESKLEEAYEYENEWYNHDFGYGITIQAVYVNGDNKGREYSTGFDCVRFSIESDKESFSYAGSCNELFTCTLPKGAIDMVDKDGFIDKALESVHSDKRIENN